MNLILLFPHQLVSTLPDGVNRVCLVEHPVFFTNQTKKRPKAKLNRLRCAYHRATEELWVRSYTQRKHKDTEVHWCRLKNANRVPWPTKKQLKGIKTIQVCDPTDDDLLAEIRVWAKQSKLELKILDNPLFIFKKEQL